MPRRPALSFPHVALTLWAALALWLVPATAPRQVVVGGVRAVATHDASALDAARLPERVEATASRTLPVLARGSGTPALVARASSASVSIRDARRLACALAITARRGPAPRRLAFPVEATAPPASLS